MSVPAQMDQRLVDVFRRAIPLLPEGMRSGAAELISPQNLAITAGVLGAWAASHAIGVGQIVDVGLLAVGVLSLGTMAFDVAASVSRALQKTASATRPADLDAAAADLAAAISLLGITLFSALIMRQGAKRGLGGTKAGAGVVKRSRFYAMYAEEWLYKIGYRRMAPRNIEGAEMALQFFERRQKFVSADDAEGWLKAMDLSERVTLAGFDVGAEFIGYMQVQPHVMARIKANPADLEKILATVSSRELGLGRFFAKVGTAIPRLGIADQNRIFCRFRVKAPVEALEATTAPAYDWWTVKQLKAAAPQRVQDLVAQKQSVHPLWFEGQKVGGGSTQYLIPEARALFDAKQLTVVDIGLDAGTRNAARPFPSMMTTQTLPVPKAGTTQSFPKPRLP